MSLPRPMSVVHPVQAQPSICPRRSRRAQYLPFPSKFPSSYRDRAPLASPKRERRVDSPPAKIFEHISIPMQAHTAAWMNVNQRRDRLALSSKPKLLKPSISGPVSPPFYPSVFLLTETNHEADMTRSRSTTTSFKQIGQEIPLEIAWHSTLRCLLRLATIVLSATVVGLLAHSLGVYCNTTVNIARGEMPTTWPGTTGTTATYMLFSIAFVNFLFAVTVLVCSVKKQFSTPMVARDKIRVMTGAYLVLSWVIACAAYKVMDADSNASLGHYACDNANTIGLGQDDYRTVCREQNTSFYIAIVAGVLEILLSAIYIFSAYSEQSISPSARDPEKDQKGHVFTQLI